MCAFIIFCLIIFELLEVTLLQRTNNDTLSRNMLTIIMYISILKVNIDHNFMENRI